MCLALGCFPEDLDRMDEATYRQWREFLRVERASRRLSGLRSGFY